MTLFTSHGIMKSDHTGYAYEGYFVEGSIQGNGVLITPPPENKRITQNWPVRQKNENEITLPLLVR